RVVKSTLIDHSYHDYAYLPLQSGGVFNSAVSTARAQNFPAKLHQIVSTPGYQHIIAWLPHGRSWHVRNKELLVSVVLKEHFSHSHFESFNRQVNLWGFKVRTCFKFILFCRRFRSCYKLSSGFFPLSISKIEAYHEAFLRGRPDLVYLVRRLKNEGKRIPHLISEPNFYQMPALPAFGLPRSDLITPAATGANVASHATASASGGSEIGGNAAVDRQFEHTGLESYSQNHLEATNQFQNVTEPLSRPVPSFLHSYPTSLCIGNISSHASKISSNSHDNRDRCSQRHASHENFPLAGAGNRNVGSTDHSRMETAPEFSSTPVGNKECQLHGHEISDTSHSDGKKHSHEYNVNEQSESHIHPNTCKGFDVSSAVTMFGSSYSSENMTPYASTYSSSTGQNDSKSNRGEASNVSVANTHYKSDDTISDPKEAHAQASTALRTETMGQQSIALLSSPPDDPLLEEFAREYLPHFGKNNDNIR
ncbi:hypothetical protein HJC23_010797, partial [Cyclotella cryptica]